MRASALALAAALVLLAGGTPASGQDDAAKKAKSQKLREEILEGAF